DVAAELASARADLVRLRQDRSDLTRGTGRWQHHPAGRAARQLDKARRHRQQAERWLGAPHVAHRERHRWRRVAHDAARDETARIRDWGSHGQPALEHLDSLIRRAETRVRELEGDGRFRHRWLADHPDLARRIDLTRYELQLGHDPVGADLLGQFDVLQFDMPE